MKRIPALLLCCVWLLCTACGKTDGSGPGGSTTRDPVQSDELQFSLPAEDAVTAVLETSAGNIYVVLYPEYAPLAVENFCVLAESGYYNGTEFHRVVRDFVIQGGDGTGNGDSGYSVWGRPFATELTDRLHHYAGALCMAPDGGRPDTNQSQFYVVAAPQDALDEEALGQLQAAGVREQVVDAYRQAGGAPYLDNRNTVFGQVYAGMDVVDQIARVAVDDNDRPKNPVLLLRVTIHSGTGAVPSAGAASASEAAA